MKVKRLFKSIAGSFKSLTKFELVLWLLVMRRRISFVVCG